MLGLVQDGASAVVDVKEEKCSLSLLYFCVDIRPMFSAVAQGRYLADSVLEMKTLVAVTWSSLEVEVVLVLVHLQVQSRFVQLEEEHLELVQVAEAVKFQLRLTPRAQSGLPVCLPTPW